MMIQGYAAKYDFPPNAIVPRRALPVNASRVAQDVRRALAALGVCPSYAPYESPGGGCSNLPPEVNASEFFGSGGTLNDQGVFAVDTSSFQSTPECPYGAEQNPWTGAMECVSGVERQYTTGSGYVVRTSTDPATMQNIAAEAQRQAQAKGVNVVCRMVPLGGDPITHAQMYGTDCTVNGEPGHDAAVLLTGGGLETAIIETGGTVKQALATSTPTNTTPSWWTPSGNVSQSQATAITNKPNASAPVTTQPGVVTVPRTSTIADTLSSNYAGEAASAAAAGGGQATDAGILGMPTNTVLLVGAAIAAVMLMNQK